MQLALDSVQLVLLVLRLALDPVRLGLWIAPLALDLMRLDRSAVRPALDPAPLPEAAHPGPISVLQASRLQLALPGKMPALQMADRCG